MLDRLYPNWAKKYWNNVLDNLQLKYGNKLDVLVNNAGGMPAERTWTNDEHDTIMASALGGTMLLTACCLPSLKKSNNGTGRVINIVSGGAYCVKCPPSDDLDFRKASKYDATLFYAYAKIKIRKINV